MSRICICNHAVYIWFFFCLITEGWDFMSFIHTFLERFVKQMHETWKDFPTIYSIYSKKGSDFIIKFIIKIFVLNFEDVKHHLRITSMYAWFTLNRVGIPYHTFQYLPGKLQFRRISSKVQKLILKNMLHSIFKDIHSTLSV